MKFGYWYSGQKWHIVKKYNNDITAICNSSIWIDRGVGNDYILPNGTHLSESLPFKLDNICKKCIAMSNIEEIKQYLINYKFGVLSG